MRKVQFIRVTENIESGGFDCGIPAINQYVRDSYFPTIAHHVSSYNIMSGSVLLGNFMIMFKEINLDQFPKEVADVDPGIKDGAISSVHVRYLAIDKRYQRKKIGTCTLKVIIKRVEDMAENWPIRVMTIDARPDLVAWYERMGFRKMYQNTIGQEGVTVAMYFDCIRSYDELKEYMDSYYE